MLNENAATLQWIADNAPKSSLAPDYGTSARYELMNQLSFLSSELHAAVRPLFGPCSEECKLTQKQELERKYKYLSNVLGRNPFLLGNTFSIADAYLYIIQVL